MSNNKIEYGINFGTNIHGNEAWVHFGDGYTGIVNLPLEGVTEGLLLTREVSGDPFKQVNYGVNMTPDQLITGDSVMLSFDNIRSIDVMIEQLHRIRHNILRKSKTQLMFSGNEKLKKRNCEPDKQESNTNEKKVTRWRCPGCGYLINQIQMELVKLDHQCPKCDDYPINYFHPVTMSDCAGEEDE